MKKVLIIAAALAIGLTGSAQAAKKAKKTDANGAYVQRQNEPLRAIPIVGTVVYGGLNYAGQLIFSPLELIQPRRY